MLVNIVWLNVFINTAVDTKLIAPVHRDNRVFFVADKADVYEQ